MKIKKSYLLKVIKEELESVLNEESEEQEMFDNWLELIKQQEFEMAEGLLSSYPDVLNPLVNVCRQFLSQEGSITFEPDELAVKLQRIADREILEDESLGHLYGDEDDPEGVTIYKDENSEIIDYFRNSLKSDIFDQLEPLLDEHYKSQLTPKMVKAMLSIARYKLLAKLDSDMDPVCDKLFDMAMQSKLVTVYPTGAIAIDYPKFAFGYNIY
jgi:hypothetical protein